MNFSFYEIFLFELSYQHKRNYNVYYKSTIKIYKGILLWRFIIKTYRHLAMLKHSSNTTL